MKSKILGISMLTLTCLYGLLAGFVILIVMIAGGDVLYAVIGSLIVLVIQFLISPWLTDLSMKWFYRAKFDVTIPEYLKKFIEEECQKHGVVYPKIGYIEDGAPNAFTYGRTKKDARIVVTKGIFDLLTEDQVKAVVGHEIGHIVHMDMLFMTALQIVPLVLYAIYEIFARNTRSNDRDGNKAAIIGYIAYILYIICQYIILWLSRTREYYADEFSVRETGKPSALAEALVRIGFGLSTNASDAKHNVSKNNALGIFDSKTSKALAITTMGDNGQVDKGKIKNAMKWEMWNPWAKWFEFNSTHPLISKRLQAITKLSQEYNEEPYIIFDLTKTESYVDDFLLEILISFLPGFTIVVGFFVSVFVYMGTKYLGVFGIWILIFVLFSYIKFARAHRKGFKEEKVSELLGEVKVSHITSVPCILNGTIIGRGNPGCIFNEDFVLRDETGIMFLDYNQPLKIINKIFALFKSEAYFNKIVNVKGWYRRSPVPYVEIYEYTVDNQTKKVYTYGLTKGIYIGLAIFAIIFAIATL